MNPVDLEHTYPIAETFISPQGEGTFTGTLMLFVRLAGCNVGKYEEPTCSPHSDPHCFEGSQVPEPELVKMRILNPKHSICTSALGDKFLCDTDYHKSTQLAVVEILRMAKDAKVDHICVTGGEPFLHDLLPLTKSAKIHASGTLVHIETSGTLLIPVEVACGSWITCSPKEGFLRRNIGNVNEYKFVVAPSDKSPEEVTSKIYELVGRDEFCSIWVQPINGVNEIDKDSLAYCLQLQKLDPRLAISIQLHKILGVR